MQIVILGMHRSGASAVARLVNMMGAYAFAEGGSIGANWGNLKGFWERRDISNLNDWLLWSHGWDWNVVSDFAVGKIHVEAQKEYQDSIQRIIINLDAHRPWMIKEPRLCLLFPLWKPLLECPVVIHVHRHPLKIAQSLNRRNGYPVEFCAALWERYTVDAFQASYGFPRLLVSYEDLIVNPLANVSLIFQKMSELSVFGLRMPSEREILTFVGGKLDRQSWSIGLSADILSSEQVDIYKSIIDGSILTRPEPFEFSDYARSILAGYQAEFSDEIKKKRHTIFALSSNRDAGAGKDSEEPSARLEDALENERQLTNLKEELSEHRHLLAELGRVIAEKDRLLTEGAEELKEIKSLLDSANFRAQKIEDRNQLFENMLNRLSPSIEALFNSKRWRFGNALSNIINKLLLRPSVPMASDHIRKILREYKEVASDPLPERAAGHPKGSDIGRGDESASESQRRLVQATVESPDDSPTVDIIVCVHNALEEVKECLNSVLRKTTLDYKLYIVNDGSDQPTTRHLRGFVEGRTNTILLENRTSKGYTKAANQGLRASEADYVILLNSDTVVTHGWLEKIIECGGGSPDIGIISPLSNAASWQSVPERYEKRKDWIVNKLPAGWGVDDMAGLVDKVSTNEYPRVPLLNGFCLAIRRPVLEKIGFLDEESFPFGYGEENDYCIRAAEAGFELAIADHLYIYHHKSASYGTGKRNKLSKAGMTALLKKYGREKIDRLIWEMRENPILEGLRQKIDTEMKSLPGYSRCSQRKALRILYLLPSKGGGGGAHSIVQEVLGMRALGVNVQIANSVVNRRFFNEHYKTMLSKQKDVVVFYEDIDELVEIASEFNIVVATIYNSILLLKEILKVCPGVAPAYYVQDYEPWFFEDGSDKHKLARESYTMIPNAMLFAKTDWVCTLVRQRHDVEVHKVEPSLDHTVFFPSLGIPTEDRPVAVSAMIRPKTPRRGAGRTLDVLRSLKKSFGDRVEIIIFGCDVDDPSFLVLERDFDFTHSGILSRNRVAELLRASDIFIDLSDYQAFGRTGLEAMACGCAVVLPEAGGVEEFAEHGWNSTLVDTQNTNDCLKAITELISDRSLRQRYRVNGIRKASEYSVRAAVLSEYLLFERYYDDYTGKNRSGGEISDDSMT